MNLPSQLALQYLKQHPVEASQYLATLPDKEVVDIFNSHDISFYVPTVCVMDPFIAGRLLNQIHPQKTKELFTQLSVNNTMRIIRSQDKAQRKTLLEYLEPKLQKLVKKLLFKPKDTVGAWSNPQYLQFRGDLNVKQALELIREYPELSKNVLFVVNNQGIFQGYVSAIELAKQNRSCLLWKLLPEKNPYIPARLLISNLEDPTRWSYPDVIAVLDEQRMVIGGITQQELLELHRQNIDIPDNEQVNIINIFSFYLFILGKLSELFFSLVSNPSGTKND